MIRNPPPPSRISKADLGGRRWRFPRKSGCGGCAASDHWGASREAFGEDRACVLMRDTVWGSDDGCRRLQGPVVWGAGATKGGRAHAASRALPLDVRASLIERRAMVLLWICCSLSLSLSHQKRGEWSRAMRCIVHGAHTHGTRRKDSECRRLRSRRADAWYRAGARRWVGVPDESI